MDKHLTLGADTGRDFSEMYEDYVLELWDRRIIKKEYGFVSYELCRDFVYISDLFIERDYREEGLGKELEAEVIEIGMDHGYSKIQCRVYRSDKSWRTNFEIYTQHCGYKMIEENKDFILLGKTIGSEL